MIRGNVLFSHIKERLFPLFIIFVSVHSFVPSFGRFKGKQTSYSRPKGEITSESNAFDADDADDDWLDDNVRGGSGMSSPPSMSSMSPFIDAFLEKKRKESEEERYTHMIGVPMSDCHQLQIELESVMKGILFHCPILSNSCITPSKSRMPLLYIDASGKPSGEVTDELYGIVQRLVSKHCYVKEEYKDDVNDYSGVNDDGYRPLTMTFHKLQIDGKKHEVLHTVADENENDGLEKLRSLVADMEVEIQSRGWKAIWPSSDEVQGNEAKMYNADKYMPRIPFMRLPPDFEFDTDTWEIDLGADGICPVFWYKWKDDVMGRHVRLPEIGIYSSRSRGNDMSEQNFFLPHETVLLPDGNEALTRQERVHQKYQEEKMGKRESRVSDDNTDDDIMDPSLSDNRKILESIYGKGSETPSEDSSRNEMEIQDGSNVIERTDSSAPPDDRTENEIMDAVVTDEDKPDKSQSFFGPEGINSTTSTNEIQDSSNIIKPTDSSALLDNETENEDELDEPQSSLGSEGKNSTSMKEIFRAFMKQRVDDIRQGETRPVKEWLEDPKYKAKYGDLVNPTVAESKENFESAYSKESGFPDEDSLRSYMRSKGRDKYKFDELESFLNSKGKDGTKTVEERIRDLMKNRIKDIRQGETRPIEEWLEDPKNKAQYDKIIDPKVSEGRKKYEAMYDIKSKILNEDLPGGEVGIQDDNNPIEPTGSSAASDDKMENEIIDVVVQDKDLSSMDTIVQDKDLFSFPSPVNNGTHLVFDTSKVSREEQVREFTRQHLEELSRRKPRPIEEWLNNPKYKAQQEKEKVRKEEIASSAPPFPSEEALMGFWEICLSPFNDPLDVQNDYTCDNFCLRVDKQISGGPVLMEKKNQKAGGGSWQLLEEGNKTLIEIRLFLPRKKEFTMVWRGEVYKGLPGAAERANDFRNILETTYLRTTPQDINSQNYEETEEIIKCEGEIWMEDTATQQDREELGSFLMIKAASLGDPDDFVYFIGDEEYKR